MGDFQALCHVATSVSTLSAKPTQSDQDGESRTLSNFRVHPSSNATPVVLVIVLSQGLIQASGLGRRTMVTQR
ncbi:hypothetical protein KC325_g178 [Hortaea werneckii]|nr:hypothetical protein KC325_g178 [Hortaea werneckii]